MTANSAEWIRLVPSPTCDLCPKLAKWKHPEGGLRCNTCPRPKSTRRHKKPAQRTAWCGHTIAAGALYCDHGCGGT